MLSAACVLGLCAAPRLAAGQAAQPRRVVIAAGALLDGKGHVVRNTRIVVEGTRIVAIDPKAGPVDIDLRGLTVLPGWIDAHAHVTWSFGADGKNAGADLTTGTRPTPRRRTQLTLQAGFTTVRAWARRPTCRCATRSPGARCPGRAS
jgi:imidazolonepropionase-like amidohydrolase